MYINFSIIKQILEMLLISYYLCYHVHIRVIFLALCMWFHKGRAKVDQGKGVQVALLVIMDPVIKFNCHQ